ncbi:uncharacterized protein LOC100831907 isoform X3 [Brachypodium distachyon]|uniref:uncharacterized protein LOC100831907 isoform X3 n=1 Tax=Brachypodium distachyon TaxID=15368 RepID=UPI0006E4A572|nr:uncharacterized protein LOC100831907 isoform X3 [Brachypodium distachyon]|eukprot:XP_014757597.1 uncharacterized protein LOC100831907 isoform X3 [Brachypodium distachyon]
MTFKSNKCPKRSRENLSLCQKKKFKPSTNSSDLSSSSSLLSVDSVCSVPASEDGHNLFKRRKIAKECNFLLTNGNVRESRTRSFTTFGDNSLLIQNGGGRSLTVPSNVQVSKYGANIDEYTTEYKEPREASKGSICKNSSGSLSDVDDRNSISISSMPSYLNHKTKDARDCSLSNTIATKQVPVTDLTSSRELCISMPKRDIPIEMSELSNASTTITHDDNERNPLFACKRCGSLEDPCQMLICDCCEGAFHLQCCQRRIKKIPDKEWFCLDCSRKNPKRQALPSRKDGSLKHIERPRRGLCSIGDMLMNAKPYETQVRIGRDFQAEVPEWSGRISCSDDDFVEPSEIDATEITSVDLQQSSRCKDKKKSIGNWIQCQEVLDTGVVCGKWRRAPLFVVQSSNWDCSCSVLWDPIHADCAVPQELETDKVLEQLQYINKVVALVALLTPEHTIFKGGCSCKPGLVCVCCH